jgi:hypothetical protein
MARAGDFALRGGAAIESTQAARLVPTPITIFWPYESSMRPLRSGGMSPAGATMLE